MDQRFRCLAFVNLNSGTASNNLFGVVRSLSKSFALKLVDPSRFRGYTPTGGAAPSVIPEEAVEAGIADGFQPDVVMAIAGGHYLDRIGRERLPGSPVVIGFAFSDPLGFDATCAIAPNFDLFYTQDPACVPLYRQRGFRVLCCPPAVDPTFFYPEPSEPEADIIFVGRWSPLRGKLISELARHFRVQVVTADHQAPWAVTPSPPLLTEDALRRAICRSRLSLEVATVEGKSEFLTWRRITNRPQFAALCGVPSLIEPFPELSLFFQEHTEIEVYSTCEELIEKANFLLSHECLRQEMGRNARTRVLANATWDIRFQGVISNLKMVLRQRQQQGLPVATLEST